MPRRRRPRPGSPRCDGDEPRPQQRNAANARERARMRVLSKAFCRLKTTLPWVPADTKLSKLDTLRLATSYIAHLRAILTDEETTPIHPLNLTWPFSFQQQSHSSQRDVTGEWAGSGDQTHLHHQDSSSSLPDGDFEDDPQPLHEHHHHDFHQHHRQFSDSLIHI